MSVKTSSNLHCMLLKNVFMGIINKKIRCKILRVVLEEYTLHIICNIINNLINFTSLDKLIEMEAVS